MLDRAVRFYDRAFPSFVECENDFFGSNLDLILGLESDCFRSVYSM